MSEQQLSQFKSQQLLTEKINHILMAKYDLQDCSLIRTASALNMTPRTVQRHLKQENTNFAALLEQEQKRRLLTYIPHYSLSSIATMLGFTQIRLPSSLKICPLIILKTLKVKRRGP